MDKASDADEYSITDSIETVNDSKVEESANESTSSFSELEGFYFTANDTSKTEAESEDKSRKDELSSDEDDNDDSDSNSNSSNEDEPRDDNSDHNSSQHSISDLETLLEHSGIPPELIKYHLEQGNIEFIQAFLEYISTPKLRSRLPQFSTIDSAFKLIKESKNIVIITGAGISVSCGIPDFRSENGIYARLKEEYPELPDPQSMFDLKFFETDPRPFFKFAKEIYPGNYLPSLSHKFIRHLEEKGVLLRNYTQNIDTLEEIAGIQNVLYCHGSFSHASCRRCKHQVKCNTIKQQIFDQEIPRCEKCLKVYRKSEDENEIDPIIKPDIVFFGENLSSEFYTALESDMTKCDLLIVIGSSLKVRPVARIPFEVPESVPQILINREPHHHQRFDVELLGNCDFIVEQLCLNLGEESERFLLASKAPGSKPLTQVPFTTISDLTSLDPDLPSSSGDNSTSIVTVESSSNSVCKEENPPKVSGTNEAATESTPDSTQASHILHEVCSSTDVSQSSTISDSEPLAKKIKVTYSAKLPENSYAHLPPNVYLFPGGQVFDSDLQKVLSRADSS